MSTSMYKTDSFVCAFICAETHLSNYNKKATVCVYLYCLWKYGCRVAITLFYFREVLTIHFVRKARGQRMMTKSMARPVSKTYLVAELEDLGARVGPTLRG